MGNPSEVPTFVLYRLWDNKLKKYIGGSNRTMRWYEGTVGIQRVVNSDPDRYEVHKFICERSPKYGE